ncbi:MAG: 4-alpha-glucanotransferase [Tardiphaga sp.]|uniref:4-alpha-glucanotransferase n=1 Tax=Tardiphaga sp. TaxID=1926292 RepID=UPI00260B9921|nr:4-alpha-glucanotransferase [Tardiphaga sp.]MDB5500178.1 4-alpha-glucanotransferase [Tardiphaga sp.]
MTHQPGIRELAIQYGVAPDYTDARGTVVQVEDYVLRRLLDSIGVFDAAASPLTASALPTLPACLVVKPGNGRVAVPLGSSSAGDIVNWRLTLEDRTKRTGTAEIRSSPGALLPALIVAGVPLGYHRLEVDGYDGVTTLIVTPGRCWLPDHFAAGEKSWGVALQLYLLRSQRNWGIGDFSDLAKLSEQLGALECDIVGLNPLHQMFLDEPKHASPYSPSDRQFLNVLNINVETIPEFSRSREATDLVQSQEFQESLRLCRAAEKVDYASASSLKLAALRLVYASFLTEASADRSADFQAYIADAGEPLRRSSLFQALRWHFSTRDGHTSEPETWPEGLRTATSSDVASFELLHQAEIGFLNWLQWIADRQLKAARDSAAAAGMRIGLYRDLAVGCDRSGGEHWSDPDAFLKGTLVGAPPDILNPSGQNWGLPPFNPATLRDRAYAPFIKLIRANMRYSGGLRIDHVMGLQRLYCIPEGLPPTHGAYVSYPIDDLIGIVALESHRHRCLVVGEDLGTVPEGFREKTADANILSYRVTFFEQDEGGAYIPAHQYPQLAVAVAGSHDLPTLKSWLSGSDIDLKDALGLYPSIDETESQRQNRAAQKAEIFQVLELEEPVDHRLFADAIHAFLARTSSLLAVTQLDDLLDEAHPVNVPGTSTEHANWRRKYSFELEHLTQRDSVQKALTALKVTRSTNAKSHEGRPPGTSNVALRHW